MAIPGGVRAWIRICVSISAVCVVATTFLTSAGCGPMGKCTGDTPVPVLSSISPNSVDISVLPVTLTVNGSHFVNWSKVYVNGAWAGTTYVSSSRLIATISADTVYQGRITSGMTVPVSVENVGTTVGAFAGSALGCANGGLSGNVVLTVR